MGNSPSVDFGPIIPLSDIFAGNSQAIEQLQQSLQTRTFATFALTESSDIDSLHHLVRDINTIFKSKEEEKETLVSEEGNIGYVKTSTREFLKLRQSDIDTIKEKVNQFDDTNASKSLEILARIGWNCFNELNKINTKTPLPEDELKDLQECLAERASLSVIHYFPAEISEGEEYIKELPNAKDICGHKPSNSFEVCSQHKDTGIFTLILTSHVPGLEVYDAHLRAWIPLEKLIQPHRDSPKQEIMILMMGHKAPLFLGKQYEPTLHRVIVERGIERPSFLYFMDTAKIS